MFTLTLDDETAARLQALAQQQNRSPNEVVRDLLGQVDLPQGNDRTTWLQRMAERAEQHTDLTWKDEPDLSERSREILKNEFADYLVNRMKSSDDEHDSA
jgi:predicted transcriptional regulator